MLQVLARNWWLIVLRGVLAILFGVLAFLWPELTAEGLVIILGAYLLVDGAFEIVSAVRRRREERRWGFLLSDGILGILLGIVALVWPEATAVALLYLIAIWAIVTGVLELFAAIELRRAITGEWLLGLVGIVSILLGVILFASPEAGIMGVVWAIGLYALLIGLLLVGLGWRLRGWRGRAA